MLEYWMGNWPLLGGGMLLGALVGSLTGLFGAGGGFIITPALNVFLGVGMNFSVGTSSCQILGASLFAMAGSFDRRWSGARVVLWVAVGVPFGSALGTWVVRRLKTIPAWHCGGRDLPVVYLTLLGFFAVFLLLIAGWMLYDTMVLARRRSEDEVPPGLLAGWKIPPCRRFESIPAGAFSLPVLAMLGGGMGFLSGLLGIGGGVVMLPALYYLVGQETRAAIRTGMLLIFISGAFGTLFHAVEGNIHYGLAGALVAGAFFGARMGVRLQKRLHAEALRRYFAWVVLGAWCMVMGKLWTLFQQV